ncbi:MAG: hypothetical protein PHI12_07345 [Dehalococcoidales bacterium]|nr:hypothetical protein [Dehalococcoidales bacterium]
MAGGSGSPVIIDELAQLAIVSQVISATQFVANGLAGFDNGSFVGYSVWVLSKVDGTTTAPKGETPKAITVFVGSGGSGLIGAVTHAAFTVPLSVGDSVLILHPAVANAVDLTTLVTGSFDTFPLCLRGTVTAVPGANQFTIPTLAGLGAGKFIDLSGVSPYYAFVFRDAAGGGAAPQNESRPITNYATLTGNFSANAFTVPVGIGDEILIIHPFLARIMNLYGQPPVTGSLVANWQAAEQNIVSIGTANTKNKVQTLFINMSTIAGTLTIRMYHPIAGVERQVYSQTFTVAADGPGRWTINGTVGIFDVLRVTAQSNNAADNGAAIAYSYMLESM